MARQLHPDKNKHSQASDVMLMINEAKEESEDTLRYNDAIREQERFHPHFWLNASLIMKKHKKP